MAASPTTPSPLLPWARETAARELAGAPERRLAHGAGVDELAARVAAILPEAERDLFLATAALHDIGFSAGARESGFQPLDGALRLEALGAPPRMAALVANLNGAAVEAELRGVDDSYERWPDEETPLRDALWFCCMTTAADGSPIDVDDRIDSWPAQYPEPVVLATIERIREPLRAAVARTAERLDDAGVEAPGRRPSLGLSGQRNFRDLGGMAAAGGAAVRRGLFFRSGALGALSEEGSRRLARFRIVTVVDLRASEERAAAPSRWHEDAAPPRAIAAEGDLAQHLGVLYADAIGDETGRTAERLMLENYRRMPTFLAPAIGELIAALRADDGPPVLVHCTAGKDRTGVVCAIVLAALGAEREEIYADYRRSDRFFGPAEIAGFMRDTGAAPDGAEVAPEVLARFASHREYLDATFAEIEGEHGSLEAYLEEVIGLDAAGLADLRQRLLEPAPESG